MVPRIQLQPNGPEISRLVYGTWRLLDNTSPSSKDLASRFRHCLDLGITTIDTAEIYGLYSVESAIGDALRVEPTLPSQIEIVTKAGIDIPSEEKSNARVNHYNTTAKNIISSAENSLRKLGVESLDIFLVHRPDWLASAAETADGLNQLIQSGKIRYAGVSNYTPHQFETLSTFVNQPLVTNQIETSLLHMDAIYDGTLDQCQRYGVCPMGWSPLAGGTLFDSSHPSTNRIQRLVEDELGPKYKADLTQLAYAWLLAHPAQIVPVIGTNQKERITNTVAATNIALDRQDWYALWQAAKGHPVP